MQPVPFPITDTKPALAAVHPLKFEIRYSEVGGTMTAHEWVEVAKKGVSIPATVPHRIDKLKKAAAKSTDPTDEHAALWAAIEPFYNNWKANGTEELVNGTPLSVWPGVTKDVVEALRPFRIYSVEDLSMLSDAIMQKVPNPNMPLYRERAKKFLATKDIAVAVRDLTDVQAENEALKARLEALERKQADTDFARREAEDALDEATPAPLRKRKPKSAEAVA